MRSVVFPMDNAPLRASFMVNIPKRMRTAPPRTEIAEISFLPKRAVIPKTIRMHSTSSSSAWPRTTLGPQIQPFFMEPSIVANNIGPGISAPDKPTAKPMVSISISSIIVHFAYVL